MNGTFEALFVDEKIPVPRVAAQNLPSTCGSGTLVAHHGMAFIFAFYSAPERSATPVGSVIPLPSRSGGPRFQPAVGRNMVSTISGRQLSIRAVKRSYVAGLPTPNDLQIFPVLKCTGDVRKKAGRNQNSYRDNSLTHGASPSVKEIE